MEIITYTLYSGPTSDQYYKELGVFTDHVIQLIKEDQGTIDRFRQYLLKTGNRLLTSDSEFGLELLTIGILWQAYGASACKAEIGEVNTKLTLPNFYKLLRWLKETGEFRETIKRLQNWAAFLSAQTAELQEIILKEANEFATEFTIESRAALGAYTKNVARFLQKSLSLHLAKEDYVFCGRREPEYHLNMVGAEIMNRAFRSAFVATERKAVLIPICLRQPKGACQMQQGAEGQYQCRGCTETCPVFQVAALGLRYGFQLIIIPHESMVFAGDNAASIFQDTGVVGVACITTLLENGWKAKALGIPVQCVPLDYCGCKTHWHPSGIGTNLNLKELSRILGIYEQAALANLN